MKKFMSYFAMAAVVLASCVKEQTPVTDGNLNEITPSGNLVEKVFTVGDVESKTYIDGTETDNGKLVVKWCASDKISVWDGVANREFTIVGEPDGNQATFKGMVDAAAVDFYAIYPYDENLHCSQSGGTILFSVSKPAVQYANPEGGLAEGAAYSCGKADAGGNISLIHRSALLKFSLADGMTVKSVTVKGNADDDILAGGLNFQYAADKNFAVGYENDENKSLQVTLCNQDGSNLKTGVDYYMALTGNLFDKGYTVTLAMEDGKELSKSSDKAVQYYSGTVYPLAGKPLSRTMFGATYYEAYQAGEDIMIAGKAYNKTIYGDGTLVKAGETTDLTAGNKVYFVEPGAVSKIGPTYSTDKYIVIGTDPLRRTQVTQEASIKIGKNNAHYAFLNLDIDMQITATGSGNDVMTVVNNGSIISRIAFDNCRMEYPTNGRWFIYKGDATTVISDFAFHNCDYSFEYTSDHIYLLRLDSAEAVHGLFDFQNNVFWHTGTMLEAKGINIVNGPNSIVGSLKFKNNTFVNLKTQINASSYFHVGVDVNDADVQNNLFYFDNDASCNMYLHRKSATSCICNNNVYYINQPGTTYVLKPFVTTPSGATLFTALESSPFTSMDLATGTFVKADAYKNYGAQR